MWLSPFSHASTFEYHIFSYIDSDVFNQLGSVFWPIHPWKWTTDANSITWLKGSELQVLLQPYSLYIINANFNQDLNILALFMDIQIFGSEGIPLKSCKLLQQQVTKTSKFKLLNFCEKFTVLEKDKYKLMQGTNLDSFDCVIVIMRKWTGLKFFLIFVVY